MQQKIKSLKLSKKINTLLIILWLGLGFTGYSQKLKLDGVATVVGKNVVLDSEIEAFKQEYLQLSEGKGEADDCEMLEKIMRRKLLAHHAVIDSIMVSEAEISSNVQQKIQYFTMQLGGSKEKLLEFYGFDTMKELQDELHTIEKESLEINKMEQKITADVDITPEEVKRYFNSLKEKNNLPEIGAEIELAQIVINIKPSKEEEERIIKRLEEIRQQVLDGESFKMKAILYSDDPGVSENGGLYTLTRESGLVKEFKETAFALGEGEISEPFKSDFGYHILTVEKIRGKERDARHILLQPKIDEKTLNKVKDSLENIRLKILKHEITFEDAVLKYSNDKKTRLNKGMILNPQSSDTHFELTRMDPELYKKVSNLKPGEFTDVFYENTREGKKMFKFLVLKSKTEPHTADLNKDYIKIKDLALMKKKEESIEKWIDEKINDTYIKINDQYKHCTFKSNWLKK